MSEFRTDDMAMVSCLKFFGQVPTSVQWIDRKCYWFFERGSELQEIVESYLERRLSVEPKQFNFIFGETKKEFYKLYDAHSGRNVGRQ